MLLLEVESNRIERISNWFLSNFSNYFSPSNQSNRKFSNRIERISNESSIWKIWFHSIVGVESNRTNFELIFIEFFEYFLPFQINRIANFRIESNEFRTNSNLTPPLLYPGSNVPRYITCRKCILKHETMRAKSMTMMCVNYVFLSRSIINFTRNSHEYSNCKSLIFV